MPPPATLKERLQDDVKTAMRGGDKSRLSVLRLAMAAIKQREVDSRETLDDDGVLSVLEKMVKQRKDSVAQFLKGNRQDLVDKEQAEIGVLEEFLPEQLDEAATAALVDDVIAASGASSPKDMGRVMGDIKSRAAGQVDMGRVSALVKARLTGT
jgi:uncharacterized protein YqeY